MIHQPVQITQEEAKQIVEAGRRQRESEESAMSALRINPNESRRTMTMHEGNFHIENHQSMRVTAEDFERPGIVGSLGAHKQHPNAIVKLPHGIDTTLEQAFRMGMVGKDASGQYYDFDTSKKNDVESSKQVNQPEQPKAFDDDHGPKVLPLETARASLEALSSSLPESQLDVLIESAAKHALDTPFDDDGNPVKLSLEGFTTASGLDESVLHGHLGSVLDGFQKAADDALKSLGVDTNNFYQFLKDEHPSKLKDVMREHYVTKNPGVWKKLVPLYRSSVLPSDEALNRAGIKVNKRDGEAYITLGGVQMTVKAAAKAGLI